jgi:nitroreductase
MNFSEIAKTRQSCRIYDNTKNVEDEKIQAILESAILSPSACNAQPYHFTVCKGEKAKEVAEATRGMGMNKFTEDVPVMIVISEESYNKTAGIGGGKGTGHEIPALRASVRCGHCSGQP